MAALVATAGACSEDAPPVPVAVAGVTLQPTTLEMEVGADTLLVAEVQPGDAADRAVTWSSSDSIIAIVADGKVSALNVGGPVTITVTTRDGGFTATCAVTVKYPRGLKVSTVAGDGVQGHVDATGTDARFNNPQGITTDAAGNVYVGETSWIRKISPAGEVTTLAGGVTSGYVDGTGSSARFLDVTDLALDASGNLYIADYGNYCIRKITPAGVVSTVAGNGVAGYADGVGANAQMGAVSGVVFNPARDILYVADMTNDCVRKIVVATGAVTTLVGKGSGSYANESETPLGYPRGICCDASGNLFVTEFFGHRVRKITPSGVVSTIAGSGDDGFRDASSTSAMFSYPSSVTVDAAGNLYVSDAGNYCIRQITPAGDVSTMAGIPRQQGFLDGPAAVSLFGSPAGITMGANGVIFVLDRNPARVRRIAVE
jgi:sugar lactone lactonase YvrE